MHHCEGLPECVTPKRTPKISLHEFRSQSYWVIIDLRYVFLCCDVQKILQVKRKALNLYDTNLELLITLFHFQKQYTNHQLYHLPL